MKSLILLSGGIDSTVALAEAAALGRTCSCLCFDYQQANWIGEWEAARSVAAFYRAPLAQCHIDGLFWRGTSFLTGCGGDPLQSYVPARNTLLIAHGVACAEAQGAEEVWFGANKDDHAFYPDCRPEFVEAISRVACLGTKSHVRVVAPHVERTKVEVVRRGLAIGAPLDRTTSCADSSGRCGVCRGCQLRRDAFAALGLKENDGAVY